MATTNDIIVFTYFTSLHICYVQLDQNKARTGEAHTYTWSIHIFSSSPVPVSCYVK